jgi:hypothetical protein
MDSTNLVNKCKSLHINRDVHLIPSTIYYAQTRERPIVYLLLCYVFRERYYYNRIRLLFIRDLCRR